MEAMTRRIAIMTLATLLGLTGCASKPTVSENQCRAGDWESIGFRDGAGGSASTRILAHQDACGEFGIVPDRNRYLAGWDDGNTSFCTAENGFSQGNRGRAASRLCSSEAYSQAHADGNRLYVARRAVNQIAHQLEAHHARLVSIKQEIVSVTSAQLLPDLSVQERIHLLADLESLAAERATIRQEIPDLEFDLSQAEAHLMEVQQQIASL